MSFIIGIALLCFPATYRPERHYMRGPGTKWYAKHHPPGISAKTALVSVPARSPEFTRLPDDQEPWVETNKSLEPTTGIVRTCCQRPS